MVVSIQEEYDIWNDTVNHVHSFPGQVSQIYALRQALAKAIVAFYQKYVDEASKKEIKEALVQYDRTLLVADPRRCEPKKVGNNDSYIEGMQYSYVSIFTVRRPGCSRSLPKVLPLNGSVMWHFGFVHYLSICLYKELRGSVAMHRL